MYTERWNSARELKRLGVLGWGMIGGIEKSSESDSAGVSDVSSPSSVTGAPSICDTTQIHTKRIRMTATVPSGKKRTALLSLRLIQDNILRHGLVSKQVRIVLF